MKRIILYSLFVFLIILFPSCESEETYYRPGSVTTVYSNYCNCFPCRCSICLCDDDVVIVEEMAKDPPRRVWSDPYDEPYRDPYYDPYHYPYHEHHDPYYDPYHDPYYDPYYDPYGTTIYY